MKKIKLREKRKRRIRAKIFGTNDCPRLSAYRSNKHIYAQLIDDEKGAILASADDRKIKMTKGQTKTEIALEVGKLIAQKALKKKFKKAVFDRGGYRYHGRVKALAEGARKEGLVL